MQKIVIIVFALAFLFKPVLPLAEYLMNYNYIIEELCINKDDENLDCNGKCHLKSELADASEGSDTNLPERKIHSQTDVLFFIETAEFELPRFFSIDKKVAPRLPKLYSYLDSTAIFHPPAIV